MFCYIIPETGIIVVLKLIIKSYIYYGFFAKTPSRKSLKVVYLYI